MEFLEHGASVKSLCTVIIPGFTWESLEELTATDVQALPQTTESGALGEKCSHLFPNGS